MPDQSADELPNRAMPLSLQHMHDFTDISYLQRGPAIHRKVYDLLTRHQLLSQLHAYSPAFVGSIPILVHTADSDIDIICCFDHREMFMSTVKQLFGHCRGFIAREILIRDVPSVVANFRIDEQPVEIFGQATPTLQQMAYRHLLIEAAILEQKGDNFRQQVVALKEKGYHTEAAFCELLGIDGDPFLELLDLEN